MTKQEAIQIFESLRQNPFLTQAVRDASKLAADVIRTGEPKSTAKWQFRKEYTAHGMHGPYIDQQVAVCSYCKCEFGDVEFNEPGEEWITSYWHFCPNCGSRMDEKNETTLNTL